MDAGKLTAAIGQAREVVVADVVGRAPGMAVAVALGGEVVWSEQFGLADVERKIPVTAGTRFRIGSVSKPLTSAGLGLLVERGLLDLDAPIQKYIPDFPEKEGVITARLLAGHLSGIRNYRGVEAVSSKPYADLRSGLKVFENDALESLPGTKYSYCSYGWNVLGVVMERAAGKDFLAFMEENVIGPLGLVNTVPDRADAVDEQRTSFYEMGLDGNFFAPPKVDLSYCWPSGGYLSSAEDLARFGAGLMGPGLLKLDTLKLLWTPQRTSDGKATAYGIGWFMGPVGVYHGGDSMGGTCALLLVPKLRLVVALAANVGHGVVGNAVRKGRVKSEDVKGFLFQKDAVVHKVAKVFISHR